MKDVIHTSWNERLVYIGINLAGLSAIFFAVSSITPGLVLAVFGFLLILSAFEAARAGVVAGIIAGSMSALGDFLLVQNYDVIGRTFEGTTFAPTSAIGSLEAAAIYVLAVDVFLAGVVGGAVLGLIFSKVHDRYLRNHSLRTRGIVFGIILWILLSLNGFGSEFGLLYDSISVLIGLVAYLSYGVLLARFFPRFKRNITENRKAPVVS
jgi:uncharacterized protein DUF6789